MEINLTSQNFQKEVIEFQGTVLVDFWAPWCGPCKMIAPAVEAVAAEYAGKIKVCKLNVDEAGDIAGQFTVMNIPTIMIFKSGKVMEKRVGALTKEQLGKLIQQYI